jgi:hypothetical protein
MSTPKSPQWVATLQIGALAGLAGGLAEVGWIALYSTVTGAPAEAVARGVVRSVFPALAASSASVWLGVAIHLAIALALGLGLALAIRLLLQRDEAGYSEYGLVIPILAAVWAVNFLIALPYINPEFVGLLPYSVTLLSKLLFGLSAAAVFRTDRMRRVRIPRGQAVA